MESVLYGVASLVLSILVFTVPTLLVIMTCVHYSRGSLFHFKHATHYVTILKTSYISQTFIYLKLPTNSNTAQLNS